MIRRLSIVCLITLAVWLLATVEHISTQSQTILDRVEAEQQRQADTIRRVLQRAAAAEAAAVAAGRVPEATVDEVAAQLETFVGPDAVREALKDLRLPPGPPGPPGPGGPAGPAGPPGPAAADRPATTTTTGPAATTTTTGPTRPSTSSTTTTTRPTPPTTRPCTVAAAGLCLLR